MILVNADKKRLAKGNLADILPSVECLWQHRWTSSVCRLIPFVTCAKPQVLAGGMVPGATAS